MFLDQVLVIKDILTQTNLVQSTGKFESAPNLFGEKIRRAISTFGIH